MSQSILMNHGSGGRKSRELITDMFYKYFDNEILLKQTDSALLPVTGGKISFTTDSFVVKPIVFPGGNIGKLSVCGTVNDIAVSGARPLYISAAFILEEGLEMSLLEAIVSSMAEESRKAGVAIVTGDTKVVGRGECDRVFINTAGIGVYDEGRYDLGNVENIMPGDHIIINGFVGDHGMAILKQRESLELSDDIKSDCTCLNGLIDLALRHSQKIRFCRDATRGGLATVLCEAVENRKFGMKIAEAKIPVRESVAGIAEMFGFDPLYMANEGKVVMIADRDDSQKIVDAWKAHEAGINASIIGEVSEANAGRVIMETSAGGRRMIDMLAGEQLPRIC